MFSYVSLEQRVPFDHPLRAIRTLVDSVLREMSPEFDRLYSRIGRPSVPPERLLRAILLQAFYTIRSERLLMEQLDYNLLFRWFVGLTVDEPVWDHSSFSTNRDRLIEANVARRLLRKVLARAKRAKLLSAEHFSVDGTLIEAWAAVKSMRRRDGKDDPPPPGRNPSVDFRGQRRSNETHVAPHDPRWTALRARPAEVARVDGAVWRMPVRAATLRDATVVAFLGVRQQHADVDVRCVLEVTGLMGHLDVHDDLGARL